MFIVGRGHPASASPGLTPLPPWLLSSSAHWTESRNCPFSGKPSRPNPPPVFTVLDSSLLLETLLSPWLTEPQSSWLPSGPLTLGLLCWFLTLSHTLCSANSVKAAQLFSVHRGIGFPCHSFSLPTTTWMFPPPGLYTWLLLVQLFSLSA